MGIAEDRTDCLRADTKSPFAIAFYWYASQSQSMPIGAKSPPLKTTMQPAIAYRDVAGALTSNYGKQPDNSDTGLGPNLAGYGSAVRRLTPRECERLQGFHDDYTFIPWRTWQESQRKGISYESLLSQRGMKLRGPSIEECPDGPRYRALGNSMAVPVMAWIGRRIQLVDQLRTEREAA